MTEEAKVTAAQEAAADEQAAHDLSNVETIKKGDIVKGKVVKIEDQQAIVSIGYKYEGVIPLRELSSVSVGSASDVVEVGQELELKVLTIDDEKEKLVLSKRAIDSEKSWEKLQKALETGEILEAQVAEIVKGGLVVDVGLRGFIPASMVERHFVEDFTPYKGRTLRLKVKELDREKNRVVLSQKDVLEEEYEAKKQEILNSLTVGQTLEGTVQRLTPFGAFIDVGGIDGLVHISEMAWHHVEKPSDVVKEGDKINVKVLKVDPANERISLSIKATQAGPWEQVSGKFNIGDVITGKVKRLASFGAFVEVAPGVEGLVHISQISHRHIGTPHEVLKEGQEVQVKVLDINIGEKRISLSIKETEEAPAQAPRAERRGDRQKEEIPEAQSLSLTLGERFGDKLSKFK
ncbi:30S ribosomal protein S1 [Paenibacillus thermoaerophilus]|uniref:30S ribosomal protein S1 n=1 Tax=Paenibacillus thermoaerophilus TaxID=1215385 RepID=A0ABW2V5C7_9BACL|nr:30S ribosomal protein S1 [Paenibacillus thermoaerophilus]TMV18725.1 30S ribosomal protein S1 [Paenibacillus thermoaerophilus]